MYGPKSWVAVGVCTVGAVLVAASLGVVHVAYAPNGIGTAQGTFEATLWKVRIEGDRFKPPGWPYANNWVSWTQYEEWVDRLPPPVPARTPPTFADATRSWGGRLDWAKGSALASAVALGLGAVTLAWRTPVTATAWLAVGAVALIFGIVLVEGYRHFQGIPNSLEPTTGPFAFHPDCNNTPIASFVLQLLGMASLFLLALLSVWKAFRRSCEGVLFSTVTVTTGAGDPGPWAATAAGKAHAKGSERQPLVASA